MEELADGTQSGALDRVEADRSQRRGLGHRRPRGGAAAQVGGEMKALHRGDYPAPKINGFSAHGTSCMAATDLSQGSVARPQAAASARTTLMANAIRALAMDAVQQANSGHPGAPMGMADIAVALWGRHLRHNPRNPHWADRDRFVQSNGHGSMLLYSLLHLTGYKLPIGELKNFRQLHSKTPGHPEVGLTPGVETTTGPLAQGL